MMVLMTMMLLKMVFNSGCDDYDAAEDSGGGGDDDKAAGDGGSGVIFLKPNTFLYLSQINRTVFLFAGILLVL